MIERHAVWNQVKISGQMENVSRSMSVYAYNVKANFTLKISYFKYDTSIRYSLVGKEHRYGAQFFFRICCKACHFQPRTATMINIRSKLFFQPERISPNFYLTAQMKILTERVIVSTVVSLLKSIRTMWTYYFPTVHNHTYYLISILTEILYQQYRFLWNWFRNMSNIVSKKCILQ